MVDRRSWGREGGQEGGREDRRGWGRDGKQEGMGRQEGQEKWLTGGAVGGAVGGNQGLGEGGMEDRRGWKYYDMYVPSFPKFLTNSSKNIM